MIIALKEAIWSNIKLNSGRRVALRWKFLSCSKMVTGLIMFWWKTLSCISGTDNYFFLFKLYRPQITGKVVIIRFNLSVGFVLGSGAQMNCTHNSNCAEVNYLATCSDVTKYTHRCPFYGVFFHCLCHQFGLLYSSLKKYWFCQIVSVLPRSGISSCCLLSLAATSALLCQMLVTFCKRVWLKQ